MNKIAISLAVLAVSSQVKAAELNKSYVELGYESTHFVGPKPSVDGPFISARFLSEKGLVVGFKYSNQKDSYRISSDTSIIYTGTRDKKAKEQSVNFGYALLNETDTQLTFAIELGVFKASYKSYYTFENPPEYVNNSSSGRKYSQEIDFHRLVANYGTFVTDAISLHANLGFATIDDGNESQSGLTYGLGVGYHFTDNASVSLDYFNGNDYDQLGLKLRYNF
jgi:opacity protein-like surface antigen